MPGFHAYRSVENEQGVEGQLQEGGLDKGK
jgi:hypothetical protein